jgi:hypothetical protein
MTDISVTDGFLKKPNAALRCILRYFKVQKVLIIAQDLRALPNYIELVNFYTLPSSSDQKNLTYLLHSKL